MNRPDPSTNTSRNDSVAAAWRQWLAMLRADGVTIAATTRPTGVIEFVYPARQEDAVVRAAKQLGHPAEGPAVVVDRAGGVRVAFFDTRPAAAEPRWLVLRGRTTETRDASAEASGDADILGETVPALSSEPESRSPETGPMARRANAAGPLWKRLLFTPYNQPAFFTVMGPEGVGKTTTCSLVNDVFDRLPLPFCQFHHTAQWKGDGNRFLSEQGAAVARRNGQTDADADADADDRTVSAADAGNRSLPYRLVREIWRRLVPAAIKRQVLAVPGELQYVDRITRLLAQASAERRIVLSDRYCYDRYVRWRNLGKPLFQTLMAKLQCLMMRRPLCAFLLTDAPERIARRKTTMPLWEIEQHQPMLVDTCRRHHVAFEVVNLDRRPPEEVAQVVARRMIECCGSRIFELLTV